MGSLKTLAFSVFSWPGVFFAASVIALVLTAPLHRPSDARLSAKPSIQLIAYCGVVAITIAVLIAISYD
jgi:hypothetical protein